MNIYYKNTPYLLRDALIHAPIMEGFATKLGFCITVMHFIVILTYLIFEPALDDEERPCIFYSPLQNL